MPSEETKRPLGAYYLREHHRRRPKVEWSEGEREALIAEALAKGRVTHVAVGVSGRDTEVPT